MDECYFMQNNAEMLAKVIKMQQKAIIYGIFLLDIVEKVLPLQRI